jgi:hypothetical protein
MLKFYSSLNLLCIVAIFCSAFFIYPVLHDSESLSLLVGGLVFIGLLITQFINLLQAFFSRGDQSLIYQKFDEVDFLLQNQLLVSIIESSGESSTSNIQSSLHSLWAFKRFQSFPFSSMRYFFAITFI